MGQNQVTNGSFEIGPPTKGVSQYYEVEGWYHTGSCERGYLLLCDELHRHRTDIEIKSISCPVEYKAQDELRMIQLGYNNNYGHLKDAFRGKADYISQKLKKPLQMDKAYKISFWYYWPTHFSKRDTTEVIQLGLMTTYNEPRIEFGHKLYKKILFVENPVLNQWKKMEWIIRPSCIQHYLTIGYFASDFEKKHEGKYLSPTLYFIDNVSIEEVPNTDPKVRRYCNEDDFHAAPSTPPFRYEQKWQLNYAPDEFEVPNENDAMLDSVAVFMAQNPNTVFKIVGHTDREGNNNLSLSQKRSKGVIDYFRTRHNIPEFRLLPIAMADKKMVANENSATANKQNRRVEIIVSTMPIHRAMYRLALQKALNKETDAAMKLLAPWARLVPLKEAVLVTFDSAMLPLRQHKAWRTIKKVIDDRYKVYKQPRLAFQLDSIYYEDQKYRMTPNLATKVLDLAGYVAEIDTTDWTFNASNEEFEKLDNLNLAFLKNILKSGTFPKSSEVGARAAKGALLVLIHSGDTTLMDKYLPIIEGYCNSGEASCELYAILFDKIRLIKGLPQRFGTQWITENGQQKLWTTEDEVNLKARRQAIGLD